MATDAGKTLFETIDALAADMTDDQLGQFAGLLGALARMDSRNASALVSQWRKTGMFRPATGDEHIIISPYPHGTPALRIVK